MQSLLRRTTDFFTPNASTTSLGKVSEAAEPGQSSSPTTEYIFPTVDPAIDGPDCQLDCSSCTIHYPAKFSIDEEDSLYGHVQAWGTHLIVATGKTDWVRDIADEKGSVMEAMGQWYKEREFKDLKNGRCMISASNMPVPDYDLPDHADEDTPALAEDQTEVIALPTWEIIQGIHPSNTPAFMQNYVENMPGISDPIHSTLEPSVPPSTNPPHTAHTDDPPTPPPDSTLPERPSPILIIAPSIPFRTRPLPHKALILLCSQRTRDARCGQSAPLLRRELERHLRPLGLHRDLHDDRPGGVGIYFISHVGGHKYSANVMVYRRAEAQVGEDGKRAGEAEVEAQAGQCIWLARVRPEDCEGIVKFTVLQGKVVRPERQLRGGFDRNRGKGVNSW